MQSAEPDGDEHLLDVPAVQRPDQHQLDERREQRPDRHPDERAEQEARRDRDRRRASTP